MYVEFIFDQQMIYFRLAPVNCSIYRNQHVFAAQNIFEFICIKLFVPVPQSECV